MIDAASFPIYGSFMAAVMKDEYKVPVLWGCYAVGAVGNTILALWLEYRVLLACPSRVRLIPGRGRRFYGDIRG